MTASESIEYRYNVLTSPEPIFEERTYVVSYDGKYPQPVTHEGEKPGRMPGGSQGYVRVTGSAAAFLKWYREPSDLQVTRQQFQDDAAARVQEILNRPVR
jgi:hypothetical protein